jgi:hypothetical protein
MLIGKRAAVHRPLVDVRQQLEQRIRREDVTRVRQDYLKILKENTAVQVDAQSMAEILRELNTTASAGQHVSTDQKTSSQKRNGHAPVPFPGQQN